MAKLLISAVVDNPNNLRILSPGTNERKLPAATWREEESALRRTGIAQKSLALATTAVTAGFDVTGVAARVKHLSPCFSDYALPRWAGLAEN